MMPVFVVPNSVLSTEFDGTGFTIREGSFVIIVLNCLQKGVCSKR